MLYCAVQKFANKPEWMPMIEDVEVVRKTSFEDSH